MSWDADRFSQWAHENHSRLLVITDQKMGAGLHRKTDPEDLLQEALARALKSLPGLDEETSDPLNWFLQILDHQIVDSHRFFFEAQKRDAAREVSANAQSSPDGSSPALIDLLIASMTSPSQHLSRNIRLDRMNVALSQLPEEARNAIRWRYLEGVSSQTIAERLGKTDGAVRVLLSRSLKKLEQMLEDVRPG